MSMNAVLPKGEAEKNESELESLLKNEKGVVIRQETQKFEAFMYAAGLPLEFKNKYSVRKLPEDGSSNPEKKYTPSSQDMEKMDAMLQINEESNSFSRFVLACCGCANLRSLKWHFIVDGGGDAYVAERPFKCGGCVCCPLESTLYRATDQQVPIGKIKEDFDDYMGKCFSCCCAGTGYTDVLEYDQETSSFAKQYTITTNTMCCGPRNNCFGATCLKSDMHFDISDKDGNVVAYLEKTYSGGGCSDFGRCCFEYSNYVFEFPPDSTPQQRILLLTAIMSVEYQNFEKDGSE